MYALRSRPAAEDDMLAARIAEDDGGWVGDATEEGGRRQQSRRRGAAIGLRLWVCVCWLNVIIEERQRPRARARRALVVRREGGLLRVRNKSSEPRLNLSGSWQQGHSAAYNTPFLIQVVCK